MEVICGGICMSLLRPGRLRRSRFDSASQNTFGAGTSDSGQVYRVLRSRLIGDDGEVDRSNDSGGSVTRLRLLVLHRLTCPWRISRSLGVLSNAHCPS